MLLTHLKHLKLLLQETSNRKLLRIKKAIGKPVAFFMDFKQRQFFWVSNGVVPVISAVSNDALFSRRVR